MVIEEQPITKLLWLWLEVRHLFWTAKPIDGKWRGINTKYWAGWAKPFKSKLIPSEFQKKIWCDM